MSLNKSEEVALKAMEGTFGMNPEQAQALEDEACMQACGDLAEMAIAMRTEKGIPELDVEKELAAFHRKHRLERKRIRVVWEAVLLGTAAAVVLFFVLRRPTVPLVQEKDGLFVFQVDSSVQQITMQVSDGEGFKPLEEAVKEMSRIVQMFPGEINYTKEKIDKAIAENKVRMHRLRIPRGETFKVVLSDGTEVLLNADSRLTYPVVFKGKERVVLLEGEAYFKVAKDTGHPFIVRSGGLRICVLGTEFNVCYYDAEHASVTLIEGKVVVSDTCGVQTVEMVPGQNTRLRPDGTFAVENVDLDPYIYWKEGYFYFDNVALADMMKEIGRWYNVDVEFRNKAAMNLQIHFFSDRRQNILHTVELLNRMEKVNAVYEEGKVVIE